MIATVKKEISVWTSGAVSNSYRLQAGDLAIDLKLVIGNWAPIVPAFLDNPISKNLAFCRLPMNGSFDSDVFLDTFHYPLDKYINYKTTHAKEF
jgi:hypothetical protein